MKVLHFQHNGVGVILSRALRELGVYSRVLSTSSHPFGFKEDYLFRKNPWLRGPFSKLGYKLEWKRYYKFDVLHCHDHSRLPDFVLNRWGGNLIQHYHDPKTKRALYDDIPSFVSLPTLLKVIPDGTWIPLPVDTDFFIPAESCDSPHINVGYCDQSIDPTKETYIPKKSIKTAARKYQAKISLKPLNYVISHDRMPNYYNQIDIWVDRIGHDFYGFSAIEVASMGKAVITQIGEEEKGRVPHCPFIDATTESVADAIITLAEDERLRKTLGRKAREYVIEVHDSKKVATICKKKYEEISKR